MLQNHIINISSKEFNSQYIRSPKETIWNTVKSLNAISAKNNSQNCSAKDFKIDQMCYI